MARFLNGPAKHVRLELRRLPPLLRVVHDSQTWAWDALDQLEDEPRASERIYAYRRVGEVSRGFICSRGKGGGCAGFIDADYRVVRDQPPDETLRDTEAWRKWAQEARGGKMENSQETD